MASQYIYHWNRIVGALVIVALVVGSAAYGISAWLASGQDAPPTADAAPPDRPALVESSAPHPTGPEQTTPRPQSEVISPTTEPSPPEGNPRSVAALVSEPAPAAQDKPLSQSASADAALAAAGPSAKKTEQPAIKTILETSAPNPPETHKTTTDPNATMGEAPRGPGPRGKPHTEEEPLLVSAETDASPDNALATASDPKPHRPEQRAAPTAARNPVFEPGETILSSPAVQRFSLAPAIERREPVEDWSALRFDANGVATIYAFSEVSGLAGATLHYHWLHEGEHVATVTTHVAAGRWRSYSSKYIKRAMSGAWSVQLRDADGQLLARADFTLQPPGASGQR